MPAHWQVDFNTMPDNLFFPAAENAVGHIDSITLSGTFNATCAFQNVVNLGALVRGKLEAKKDPEERVVQVCRKYIQWSVEDVRTNLKGNPVITPRVCLIASVTAGLEREGCDWRAGCSPGVGVFGGKERVGFLSCVL